MQDKGQRNVNEIIYDILAERENDFSWSCEAPYYNCDGEFDTDVEEDFVEEEIIPSNPTIDTLNNIRNLCDVIQNSVINSNTTNEQVLMIELMEIENKLRECNDNLNTLQNFTNNQPQILTGDIVLS